VLHIRHTTFKHFKHASIFYLKKIYESIYPEMEGKSTNGKFPSLLDFRENCRYICSKLISYGELFN